MFVKIFTTGHVVPSDDTILSFKRAVRRFLRDNADNGVLRLEQVCCSVSNMSQTIFLKRFHCGRGGHVPVFDSRVLLIMVIHLCSKQ